VADAALRDSLVASLTTDLAIPRDAVRSAMKVPKPEAGRADESVPDRGVETIKLSEGLSMLCRLALTSPEVREWLRGQTPAVDFEPGGALLDAVARVEGDVPESRIMALAAADLGEGAERTLSAMESRLALDAPLERARQIWAGLVVQKLRERMEGLKNSLGKPNLTSEERAKIQKQILDLKIRVADVFRPA
jgi:hypothetical protein